MCGVDSHTGPVTPESPAGHAPSLPCRRGPKAGLLAAGPICAVGGQLGTPQGDYHPLGLAAPQVTLIRASSPWGLGRAAQLGSHVASCWLLGHWQFWPIRPWRQVSLLGSQKSAASLGFLKKSGRPCPCGGLSWRELLAGNGPLLHTLKVGFGGSTGIPLGRAE